MKTKHYPAVLLRIGALILAVAVVARFAAGLRQLEDLKYATVWHVSAGEIAVTPIDPKGLQNIYADRQYYQLEFELTNNSNRDIYAQEYWFSVKPQSGESYSVWLRASDGCAEYGPQPKVPAGCTGTVRLLLEVQPDALNSPNIQLLFDAYGTPQQLGVIILPA